MTKVDIISVLAGIKEEAKALDFEKIGLFGSYATSTATVMSDIDIAVFSNKEKTGFGFAYLEKLEQLRHKFQKLFKRPIDLYDLNRSTSSPIQRHIEQEVIHVY